MKHFNFTLRRITISLAMLTASVGLASAQSTDILFNSNNFPDPVLRTWLSNYVQTNCPSAFLNNGQSIDPSQLTTVLQDLANDPVASQAVTDLRCMRWFPSQKCLAVAGWPNSRAVDLTCFPQLKYIDLSGWKTNQVMDFNRTGTTNNLEFARFKDCKSLTLLEYSWLGRYDIFDLAGCDSLHQIMLTNTEVTNPTIPGQVNYCNTPRFRYLDLSSSPGINTYVDNHKERVLNFGTFPQLTIMDLPQVSDPDKGRIRAFRLSDNLLSYLGTGRFLENTDTVEVSNNRLINMNIISPQAQSVWKLGGNNFSHIEVTKFGNQPGNVIPSKEVSTYMAGMASAVSTKGWDKFGKWNPINNCSYNPQVEELQWTPGNAPAYNYASDYANLALDVYVQNQKYPLIVTLTSRYDLDPKTNMIIQRPTPAVYVFTSMTQNPNIYYSPKIPSLVGPFEIDAYIGNGQATSPNGELYCFPLKGHPKEATYNDEPETANAPFKRLHNGVITPDWWPVVMTDSVNEQRKFILQAGTYFHSANDTVPPTLGANKHDIDFGAAIPATRADLEFTTFNSWTDKGQVLYEVEVKVEYIEGNPLGEMFISAQKSVSLDELEVGVAEIVSDKNLPEQWYDLTGRQINRKPSSTGVYIQVKGTEARKIKI